MYEVTNIGTYDNNHKLYEVTIDTQHGRAKYLEKTTYIVANNDADKFEHFYQKENQLYEDMKILDTPEHQRKASLKLKFGMILGTIIGAGLPLSVFGFTRNKYARIASVIASVIGGLYGLFTGLGLATEYGAIPKDIRKEFFDNHAEFVKLDAKKVREEKQKIGEINYSK